MFDVARFWLAISKAVNELLVRGLFLKQRLSPVAGKDNLSVPANDNNIYRFAL